MMTERERRVVRTANELVRRHGLTLPVDIAALCGHYGVRLVTLSELERRGMSREAVFAVWGNRDGVAMSGRRGRAIGYNDCAAEKRIGTVPGANHGESYLKDKAGCEKALREFINSYV